MGLTATGQAAGRWQTNQQTGEAQNAGGTQRCLPEPRQAPTPSCGQAQPTCDQGGSSARPELGGVDGRGAYKVLKGGSLAFADGSSLGWQRAGGWQQREEAKEAGGGGA